ncbi:MAG: hypothetical protein RLZZ338_1781, partial [Cyanobacteriota bacterium]
PNTQYPITHTDNLTSNTYSPIPNSPSPIANHHFPIPIHQSPITNHQLPFPLIVMLYNLFKFIVGVFLALIIMTGASVTAALYFAAKLTALPEKPIYPNDKKPASPTVAKTPSTAAKLNTNPNPTASSTPTPTPTPSPSESPSPSPKPLPSGAYRATVTQPIGLIVRDKADNDANRVGGIGYKEDIIVLEESPDKRWQRIRVKEGELEGWVKAGNTDRATTPSTTP